MQLVTLFRFVEVLVDVSSSATLNFLTDLPGDALSVRGTATIPATTARHPYRLTLNGTAKGKIYQVSITPVGSSIVRLYSGRVWAKVLGPTPTPWQWYTIPVLETPVDWIPMKLPIPETSDQWQSMKLPIPPTPDDWTAVKLPIPETSDAWQEMKLPIPQTSDAWQEMKLPIPPTPDDFQPVPLPVKPTPVVPEWIQVPVDQ